MADATLVGGVYGPERVGREPYVGPHLYINRGLKSGKLDVVELDRKDLLTLIATAAEVLKRMEGSS